MIRIVLADDQQLVRAGFRMILRAEPGIEVVGEAADGVEAVECARRLRPDLVLMDVRMPRLNGIEATRQILRLLARGQSNADIARDLFISEATVKTHVAHLLSKLGLTSRTQAVVLAYETRLVSPD